MGSQPKKVRVGITGASGFIGRQLVETLSETADIQPIPFDRKDWEEERAFTEKVARCDTIVHLAGVNRHPDPAFLYRTNVALAEKLARALERSAPCPAIFYISSIREGEDTAYGRSKAVCRAILDGAAQKIATLRLPNVFGPGAAAYDNSFIATFSHQLLTGRIPKVTEERTVPLLHIASLCNQLKDRLLARDFLSATLPPDFHLTVRQTLALLERFAAEYRARGRVAPPPDPNEARLLETFLSHAHQ